MSENNDRLAQSFLRAQLQFVRHIDALLIDVFAKVAIKAGEELSIDYQMTLWFDPVQI